MRDRLAEFKYGGIPKETFAPILGSQDKPNMLYYYLKKVRLRLKGCPVPRSGGESHHVGLTSMSARQCVQDFFPWVYWHGFVKVSRYLSGEEQMKQERHADVYPDTCRASGSARVDRSAPSTTSMARNCRHFGPSHSGLLSRFVPPAAAAGNRLKCRFARRLTSLGPFLVFLRHLLPVVVPSFFPSPHSVVFAYKNVTSCRARRVVLHPSSVIAPRVRDGRPVSVRDSESAPTAAPNRPSLVKLELILATGQQEGKSSLQPQREVLRGSAPGVGPFPILAPSRFSPAPACSPRCPDTLTIPPRLGLELAYKVSLRRCDGWRPACLRLRARLISHMPWQRRDLIPWLSPLIRCLLWTRE
jgi:hypothetical protein